MVYAGSIPARGTAVNPDGGKEVTMATPKENILRGVTQKDMKQALRSLLKQGWEAEVTGGTHLALIHQPTGARMLVPLTSSNRNAGKYLRNNARKAIKGRKNHAKATA